MIKNQIDKDVKLSQTELNLLDWCAESQLEQIDMLIEQNLDAATNEMFKIQAVTLRELRMTLRPSPPELIPDEIHTCDFPEGLIHMANFNYYTGLKYAECLGLKQSKIISDIRTYKYFVVCCGYVTVRVRQEDFPNIKRIPL